MQDYRLPAATNGWRSEYLAMAPAGDDRVLAFRLDTPPGKTTPRFTIAMLWAKEDTQEFIPLRGVKPIPVEYIPGIVSALVEAAEKAQKARKPVTTARDVLERIRAGEDVSEDELSVLEQVLNAQVTTTAKKKTKTTTRRAK